MKRSKANQYTLWGLFGILGYLGFREFYLINVMAYVGQQNIWDSRRYIAFLAASILAAAGYLAYGCFFITRGKTSFQDKKPNFPIALRWLVASGCVLLPGLIKWFLPLPANFTFGYWQELLLIYVLAAIAGWFISTERQPVGQALVRTAALMMAAGVFHAIFLKMCQVTDYPFTLFWSEGNRFFDYSALFGSFRYIVPAGEKVNAFISWGMQLPWAIPFIFPNLNIGAFRLWYQLVWIIPALLLGLTAAWAKPFKGKVAAVALAAAGWTFLFLDQGPIYPPLILAALLTLLAVRVKLPLGIILVIIASFYTKQSRWTWSYSPGLWAAMLTLLESEHADFSREGLKKLVKPALLGVSGYFGGQILPPIVKGISLAGVNFVPDVVGATTRQPLLWERLLPNPTFPTGILYGLLWAALPLVILLVALTISRAWKINWLQGVSMVVIAAAFLAVGLIASVKIGGGSNLHNLDNFLVTLVMLAYAALVYLRKTGFTIHSKPFLLILVCIALVAPVTYALQGGTRLNLPGQATTDEVLSAVTGTVDEYKARGEILFIDQRQLLTFGMINDVPLVSDYEKKYLMDQAMAGNAAYFQGFYQDLAAARFALIVNEPSNFIIRGSESSFGQENDAYVKWVTVALLCTYEPIYTSPEVGIELLVPRQTVLNDANCQEMLQLAASN